MSVQRPHPRGRRRRPPRPFEEERSERYGDLGYDDGRFAQRRERRYEDSGEVTLEGSVPERSRKRAAEDRAESISGVRQRSRAGRRSSR
jgi:hypothetical protein